MKVYLATANAAEIFVVGDTAQVRAIFKSIARAHKKGLTLYAPKYETAPRFRKQNSVYGIQIGEAIMKARPEVCRVGKQIYTYTEVEDILPTIQIINSDTLLKMILNREIQEHDVSEIQWGNGVPDDGPEFES